jgi:hypothetical protein
MIKIDNVFTMILNTEAKRFAAQYDANIAHLDGKNQILNSNSISGLYLLCLVNTNLFKMEIFKTILCAKNIRTEFIQPIYLGDVLYCNLSYNEYSHKTKINILIRKSIFTLIRDNKIVAKFYFSHYLSKGEISDV